MLAQSWVTACLSALLIPATLAQAPKHASEAPGHSSPGAGPSSSQPGLDGANKLPDGIQILDAPDGRQIVLAPSHEGKGITCFFLAVRGPHDIQLIFEKVTKPTERQVSAALYVKRDRPSPFVPQWSKSEAAAPGAGMLYGFTMSAGGKHPATAFSPWGDRNFEEFSLAALEALLERCWNWSEAAAKEDLVVERKRIGNLDVMRQEFWFERKMGEPATLIVHEPNATAANSPKSMQFDMDRVLLGWTVVKHRRALVSRSIDKDRSKEAEKKRADEVLDNIPLKGDGAAVSSGGPNLKISFTPGGLTSPVASDLRNKLEEAKCLPIVDRGESTHNLRIVAATGEVSAVPSRSPVRVNGVTFSFVTKLATSWALTSKGREVVSGTAKADSSSFELNVPSVRGRNGRSRDPSSEEAVNYAIEKNREALARQSTEVRQKIVTQIAEAASPHLR